VSREHERPFGFSERWFTLGLVTDELLAEMQVVASVPPGRCAGGRGWPVREPAH
jgi:hypothetical protein